MADMTDKSKTWVEGPFELIKPSQSGAAIGKKISHARAFAAEMSTVHNGLIRGINACYNQCINVAAKGTHKDKVDFANFAAQVAQILHEHHDMEEEQLFPQINVMAGVPGLMDGNVAEHLAFHEPFEKYEAYLTDVKTEKVELDGEHMRKLIDDFMGPLYIHLVGEIDSLVALEKYGDDIDWHTWFNSEVEKMNKGFMKQSAFRTELLPLYMVLHDGSYADGIWKDFPPIPFIMLWILRFLFMHKNAAWWRFAGCDLYSRPKELPFA